MVTMQYHSSKTGSGRPRWWDRLRLWERVALVVVLLGTLVVSAALIYFRPGDNLTAPNPPPAPQVATAGSEFPPGTRWYYQRGQWVPQDQQEPVQP
jgi:hypothetical protein